MIAYNQLEKVEFDEGYRIMKDRCEECGYWYIQNTEKCPECGNVVDLSIDDVCISWKCRECEYAVAATANKLCYWDAGKYSKDNYSKLDICIYAETIK